MTYYLFGCLMCAGGCILALLSTWCLRQAKEKLDEAERIRDETREKYKSMLNPTN